MHYTSTFTAGLPQLDVHTLSEDWALATALENHWIILADLLGLKPSEWLDARGERMYGAVIALRTRFDLTDTIREDDRFEARTTIHSIRKPHALSRTEYVVDGQARASVDLFTSFIKRTERGSNKRFSRVRDVWNGEDHAPELVDAELDRHHAMKTAAFEGPVAMEYEVNRIQDFNTADFMYFKNFVRIAKAAEWRQNRGEPTRLNAERAIWYFGNVGDGEEILVHVARDGDRVDSLLADRAGRRLALSHATAPVVEIAER